MLIYLTIPVCIHKYTIMTFIALDDYLSFHLHERSSTWHRWKVYPRNEMSSLWNGFPSWQIIVSVMLEINDFGKVRFDWRKFFDLDHPDWVEYNSYLMINSLLILILRSSVILLIGLNNIGSDWNISGPSLLDHIREHLLYEDPWYIIKYPRKFLVNVQIALVDIFFLWRVSRSVFPKCHLEVLSVCSVQRFWLRVWHRRLD